MFIPALVQPLSLPLTSQMERRRALRHMCKLEAVSRPTEDQDGICWGATVRDISTTGVGLNLCYPFRPGTYLAIDIHAPEENRTFLGKVVHVRDQSDGTWLIGCEFVRPIDESDLDAVV